MKQQAVPACAQTADAGVHDRGTAILTKHGHNPDLSSPAPDATTPSVTSAGSFRGRRRSVELLDPAWEVTDAVLALWTRADCGPCSWSIGDDIITWDSMPGLEAVGSPERA